MPILVGLDGHRQDVEVASATPLASPRAFEMFGQLMSISGRKDVPYFDLVTDRTPERSVRWPPK